MDININLDGLNGELERPVDATEWFVPDRVELQHRDLSWSAKFLLASDPSSPKEFTKSARPRRGMLEEFTRLEDGDPEKILRYARKWGLLGVQYSRAAYGRTIWSSHNIGGPKDDLTLKDDSGCWHGSSRLYIWTYWAKRITAALRVGTAIQEGKAPDIEDWTWVYQQLYIPRREAIRLYNSGLDVLDSPYVQRAASALGIHSPKTLPEAEQIAYVMTDRPTSSAREALVDIAVGLDVCKDQVFWKAVLTQWYLWRYGTPKFFSLEHARVAFFFELGEWQRIAGVELDLSPVLNDLVIRTHSLFGGLIWQLISAVTRSGGMAICSECRATYRPTRQPREGERRYCPRCRNDGVRVRNAVRVCRERQKEARRLHAAGAAPKDIAKQLGSDLKTVKRWITQA